MGNAVVADEKRRFHRILYNADAILTVASNHLACKVVDLSLKGCLVEFDQPWSGDLDLMYSLTIQLSAVDSITMQLAITHVDGNRIGLKCEAIDIDSISNLRRLVELNLGDSGLLERELSALSDYPPA
jgi:hypothetical protein